MWSLGDQKIHLAFYNGCLWENKFWSINNIKKTFFFQKSQSHYVNGPHSYNYITNPSISHIFDSFDVSSNGSWYLVGGAAAQYPTGWIRVMVSACPRCHIKLCLHVACASVFALMSTLTFSQWLMQRMGSDPFSACAFASPLTQC